MKPLRRSVEGLLAVVAAPAGIVVAVRAGAAIGRAHSLWQGGTGLHREPLRWLPLACSLLLCCPVPAGCGEARKPGAVG